MVGLPEIGTLDPARASSPSALTLLRTACNGLVGADYESGAPKPALARSWSLSEQGRKLLIVLRPGLKFPDGTPVTSGAVREALSRVARPSTASPWASLVSRVEGFREVQSGEATSLSGVRATDDLQLEISFSEPFSGFVTILAHPALIPVSLKSLNKDPRGPDLPVCSGPYRVQRGVQANDLRLSKVSGTTGRNDAFLNAGKGRADLILVRAFDSGEDAYAAYLSGRVDVAPVPVARVGEARTMPGLRSEAIPQITYLALDQTNPALKDPRTRQAVSLAVDRLAIIDAAYGDQRRPASGWLPDGYGGAGDATCGSFIRRVAAPERAKQLLSEVGAPQPFAAKLQLTLYYDDQNTGRLVAEALKIQIEQVLGITVNATSLQGQDPLASFASKPTDASAWIMTTRVDLGLAEEFLGEPAGGDAAANPLAVSGTAFADRINEARRATSRAGIEQSYRRAEAELCRQMPGVPLWTGVSSWMFRPGQVKVASAAYIDSLGAPLLRHAFAANG